MYVFPDEDLTGSDDEDSQNDAGNMYYVQCEHADFSM